jgi:hypothetical protein
MVPQTQSHAWLESEGNMSHFRSLLFIANRLRMTLLKEQLSRPASDCQATSKEGSTGAKSKEEEEKSVFREPYMG